MQTKREEYLHFTLGTNAGILIQNIAHEHLFCNSDPEKAIETIVGTGCPEEYVFDILQNKLYLGVRDENTMCILSQDKVPADDLPQYHNFNPNFIEDKLHNGPSDLLEEGEDILRNIYRFFATNLLYVVDFENVQKWLDLPKQWDWSASVKLSPLDIAKIYFAHDTELMTLIEEGNVTKCFGKDVGDIFNDLGGIKKFADEGMRLIKTANFLVEHGMGKEPSDFMRYASIVADIANLLVTLQEVDEDTLETWKATHRYLENSNDVVDRGLIDRAVGSNKLQMLVEDIMKREQFNERDISEPVQWDHNWTAGFVDREGHIYAMDGFESNLAHINLADALYEKNTGLPLIDNNKDWSLDRLGWVRFHEGKLRYSGYNLVNCGYAMRDLSITSRQRDRLAEYTEKFYPNGVYNEGIGDDHTFLKAEDWRTMTDDELREVFEM